MAKAKYRKRTKRGGVQKRAKTDYYTWLQRGTSSWTYMEATGNETSPNVAQLMGAAPGASWNHIDSASSLPQQDEHADLGTVESADYCTDLQRETSSWTYMEAYGNETSQNVAQFMGAAPGTSWNHVDIASSLTQQDEHMDLGQGAEPPMERAGNSSGTCAGRYTEWI